MATVEIVDVPADGSSVPAGQYHSTEVLNLHRAANGLGVVGHTISATVTGGNRLVTLPAFDAICPDGSGGSKLVSYAGGDATITASDGSNPRTDIITMDVNGTLGVTDGTATTETGSVNEAPMPALASDEVLIAKVRSPATQTNVQPNDVVGRAIDISEAQPAYVKGSDIASGATLTLPDTNEQYFDITGTTTVTALSTKPAGFRVTLQFDGILTFTHNATTLILDGADDILTEAGFVVGLISEGSGNWREIFRKGSLNRQIVIVKAATETVNNSTTLQADDDFTFAVAANEVWTIVMHLYVSFLVASDFKGAFTVPAGTTGMVIPIGRTDGVADSVQPIATIDGNFAIDGARTAAEIQAVARVGGTAGTITLTWAQFTGAVEDTSILADSFMIATKVS